MSRLQTGLALLLAACSSMPSNAPCSADSNCPTGERCDLNTMRCVAGGAAGAGGVAGVGGGSGGGAAGVGGGAAGVGGGSDTTPPAIVGTSPTSGAMGAPTTGSLSITFSEPVVPASVTVSSMPMAMFGMASFDPTNTSVSYTMPMGALMPSTMYVVTVAATDVAGNALAVPTTFSFTTAAPPDTAPPTVVSTVPTSMAVNVAFDAGLVVTFSEPMTPSSVQVTVNRGAFQLDGPVFDATNTVARFAQAALVDGGVGRFEADTTYTVAVQGSDAASNAMPMPFSFSFVTQSPPDMTPPTVVTRETTPADGATGVPSNTALNIVFSEPMLPASALNKIQVGGMLRPGTYRWNSSNTILSFKPSSAFFGAVTVTFASPPPTDVAGNALTNWTMGFSANLSGETGAPSVASTSPVNGSNTVSPFTRTFFVVESVSTTSVSVTFSEAMDRVSTEAAFQLRQTMPTTAVVSGKFTWSGTALTFTPNSPFDYGARYELVVSSSATDLAGNSLSSPFAAGFRTVIKQSATLNSVSSGSGFFTAAGAPQLAQPIRVGDNTSNVEVRGILQLSTSYPAALTAGAYLLSAQLVMSQTGVTGTAFSSAQGSVIVEGINVNNGLGMAGLDASDFSATALSASFPFRVPSSCEVSNSPMGGVRRCNITRIINSIRSAMTPSDYRLRFRFNGMMPVISNSMNDAVFFDVSVFGTTPTIELVYEVPQP